RERLRILARVMHASSASLFDRLGVSRGQTCLDAGCGGGDATLELARRVGPDGRVVGLDIDRTKLQMARAEADQQGVTNVEFRASDLSPFRAAHPFHVVYARFLLTHLGDPGGAVRVLVDQVRPGGLLGVEDIDFSGNFTWPDSPAFRRYQE